MGLRTWSTYRFSELIFKSSCSVEPKTSIFHRLGIKAISWWVAEQVRTNKGLWRFAYFELKAFEKYQMLEDSF